MQEDGTDDGARCNVPVCRCSFSERPVPTGPSPVAVLGDILEIPPGRGDAAGAGCPGGCPTAASSSPALVPELSAVPVLLTSRDAFSILLHASLDGLLLCSPLTHCKENIIGVEVVSFSCNRAHPRHPFIGANLWCWWHQGPRQQRCVPNPRQLLLTAEFLPCCRISHFPSRDAETGLASHLEAPARESPPASVDVRGLTAAGLWAVAANPSAGTVLPLMGCLLLLLLWDLVLPLAESPWPGVGCSYC